MSMRRWPVCGSSRSRCGTGARAWSPIDIAATAGISSNRPVDTIFFAGDTAYTEKLADLKDRGPIDLAILPIGAYDPWIVNHVSPEEAWQMFRATGARVRATDSPLDVPVESRTGG